MTRMCSEAWWSDVSADRIRLPLWVVVAAGLLATVSFTAAVRYDIPSSDWRLDGSTTGHAVDADE